MRDSLSSVLSQMPAAFHADREELLDILLRDGILHRSPTQPVLSRDGSSARWMLDSLSFTLRPRGAELAARCLTALLQHFDGKQLATYGLTGVPIMQSVILHSGGRYHGLIIRKEIKAHGSLRRIEGRIDPDEPTIVIDDSISSGFCMDAACSHLQEAGLRVEGGVSLVRFGWNNGYALMQERGYHVEAVFDVWDDLMTRMEGELRISRNPSKRVFDMRPTPERLPNGLHPATAARRVLEQYLRSDTVPLPPDKLDANYDSRGGVWISVRDRDEIYCRYARDGFWHFPGESHGTTAEDIVRAAIQTAEELKKAGDPLAILSRSHIAVTFFGPLEECTVGELDNDRYGIVVCSRERPGQMGGALPRMPGISNEWEQFRHAWRNNAQLRPFEPFVIYRHEVSKAVEPGAQWQPSGIPTAASPSPDNAAVCHRIAERARDIAASLLLGRAELLTPLPDTILPRDVHSVFVTVYTSGMMRGCAGSQNQSIDSDIHRCTEAAVKDDRFADTSVTGEDDVAVKVSFLMNPLLLGELSPEEVRPRFQLGRQALSVSQGRRTGMLLPFVAITDNLDRAAYIDEVVDKAGITRPPYYWTRYDCEAWLSDKSGTVQTKFGLRVRPDGQSFERTLRDLAHWQLSYLLRMQREDGSLSFTYLPFQNYIYSGAGMPRSAHASWVLAGASRLLGENHVRNAADKLITVHVNALRESDDGIWMEGEGDSSVSELAFLLLALCELDCSNHPHTGTAERLARMLWSRIDQHGRVQTHRNETAATEAYQDYFPQQVLLALAAAAENGICVPDEQKLHRALRYYRHRFRYNRNFGQVSWLMQAGARHYSHSGATAWSDLVFEIGDWICTFQVQKNGGFVCDYQEDGPGYTTTLFLEGLSAALSVAVTAGDHVRYAAYSEVCRRGVTFLKHLTFSPDDDTILPNGEFAAGGVRGSLTSSAVRTDFVQHSLAAILTLFSHFGLDNTLTNESQVSTAAALSLSSAQ